VENSPVTQKKKKKKKPSSDGLPYESTLKFWEVVGPELLAVLQEAFQAQH